MRWLAMALALAVLAGGCGDDDTDGKDAARPPERENSGDGGYLDTLGSAYTRAERMKALLPAKKCVQAFAAIKGRRPKDLDELKKEFPDFPQPPEGLRFKYDPQTGEIALVREE